MSSGLGLVQAFRPSQDFLLGSTVGFFFVSRSRGEQEYAEFESADI
jgi:hypothetical protein